MKRLHLHMSVPDLGQSIAFYEALFGAGPSVVKDDYAKWMLDDPKVKQEEKGCTEPLHGKKAKGVILIMPQENTCPTFQIDKSCLKSRTCRKPPATTPVIT